MARDEDIEFDDFDEMDDFDDMGDYDSVTGGNAKPSGREVAQEVATGAVTEILSASGVRTVGKAIKDNALPTGFKVAIDKSDGLLQEGADLIKKSDKQLGEAKEGLKRVVRDNEKMVDKLLPKKLAEKLKRASKEASRGAVIDPREAAIAVEAASIFKSLEDRQDKAYQVAKDEATAVKDDLARKTTTDILVNISNNVGTLAGYQNNILINYQRKDLEIKHRQLFLLQDLLKVTKANTDISKDQLNSIIRNTALPDAIKTKLSEEYKEMIRKDIAGGINAGLATNATDTVRSMVEKGKNIALEKITGLGEGIVSATDMADMVGSTMGGDEDMPGLNKYTLAAGIGGGMLGRKLLGVAAKKIASYIKGKIKDDPALNDGSADLMYLMTNYGELVREWAQSSEGIKFTAVPIVGGFLQRTLGDMEGMADFIRGVVPGKDNDRSIKSTIQAKALETVQLDQMMRKSWVEVIPGYLSRILEQVTNIATGEQNPRLIYSTETDSFITVNENDNIVANQVFNKDVIAKRLEEALAIVDDIDKDKTLSIAARMAFARQILKDRDAELAFKPERYLDPSRFSDPVLGEEVGQLIIRSFGEGGTGNRVARQKTAEKVKALKVAGRELDSAISVMTGTGELEAFDRMGLLTRDGSGVAKFDNERLARIFSGEENIPTAVGVKPERSMGVSSQSPTDILRNNSPPPTTVKVGKIVRQGVVVPEENKITFSKKVREPSPVITGLQKLMDDCCSKTHSLLTDIKDILSKGINILNLNEGPNGPGGPGDSGGVGGAYGNAWGFGLSGKFMGGVSRLGGIAANYASYMGGLGKGIIDSGLGAVKSLYGGLGKGINAARWKYASDVYVGSETEPRLRKVLMEQGFYLDKESGDVINTPEDIKGEVIDKEGNVYLSLSELKDIHLADGTLLSNIGSRLLSMVGKAGSALGGVYGLYGAAFTGALNIGKSAYSKAKNKLNALRDVYIPGEVKPRILAAVMKAGGYFDAKTGEVITKLEDIKGDVIDAQGNIVLNLDDLRNGLVDRFGVSIDIKSIGGYLLNAAGNLAGKATGLIKKGFSAVAGAGRGAFNLAKKTFSGFKSPELNTGSVSGLEMGYLGINAITSRQDTQIDLLKAIYSAMTGQTLSVSPAGVIDIPDLDKVVNKVTASEIVTGDDTVSDVSDKAYLSAILDELRADNTENVLGDADKNGYRDNSWRDILRRRKEAEKNKEEENQPKEKAKKEKGDNILTKIMGLVSTIGTGLSSGFGMVKDGLMALAAGLGARSLLKGGVPDVGTGKSKATGKKGLVRGLFDKAKKLISLKNLKRGGKIGIAIGLAYGAKKLWDNFTLGDKPKPIEGLRFIEYGANLNDHAFIKAIRKLENLVSDNLTWSNGVPDIDMSAEEVLEELAEDFGVITSNPQAVNDWAQWYGHRFSAIYLTHQSVLNAINKAYDTDASLDDIDDDLDADKKAEFIRRTRFTAKDFAAGNNPYAYINSPMVGITITNNVADVDFYASRLLETLTSDKGLDNYDPLQYVKGMTVTPGVSNKSLRADTPINKARLTLDKAKTQAESGMGDMLMTGASGIAGLIASNAALAGVLSGGGALLTGGGLSGAAAAAGAAGMGSIASAGSLAATVAGAITLPGLAIAAAVAGVGYGGYKLYEYFSLRSDLEPLEMLRFLEYGVEVKNPDFVLAVRKLEHEVLGEISWSGPNPSIDKKPDYFLKEVGDAFGVITSNPQVVNDWMQWFTKRFVPVFLTHLTVLKQLDDSILISDKLDDIDDDLDDDKKRTFILRTRFKSGEEPYKFINSPMTGVVLKDNRQLIAAYVERLLSILEEGKDIDSYDIEKLLPVNTKSKSTTAPVTAVKSVNKAKEALDIVRSTSVNDLTSPKSITGNTPAAKAAIAVAAERMASVAKSGVPGKIMLPVEGRLSSKYGLRIDPVTGKVAGHKGLDFAAPTGTPIYAAADGVVGRRYRSRSYGNVIYLFHDDGRATRYAHMSRFADKQQGDRVRMGDLLGYVGSTGKSTGPHLHFEYRKGQGQWDDVLNPVDYFAGKDKESVKKAIEEEKAFVKAMNETDSTDNAEGTNTLTEQVAGNKPSNVVTSVNAPLITGGTISKSKVGIPPVTDTTLSNVRQSTPIGDTIKLPEVNVERPINKLINVQDQASKEAMAQRQEQLEIQKETLARMERLISVMEGLSKDDPYRKDIKEIIAKDKETMQRTQPNKWGPTKSTNGVVGFDH